MAVREGRSRDNHDLPARSVLFHAAVRFHDLVEVEHAADLHLKSAGGDFVNQLLERHPHEIVSFAAITGETHGGGDSFQGRKIIDGPAEFRSFRRLWLSIETQSG